MTGDNVSHYRLLEPLGTGGRGVVYKAVDLRLGRLVALKFLSSPAGEGDEEVKRFLREARAAAAIEHPNLCTVYEIDETASGQLFLAMAFYEGETLEARILRGPLDLAAAVGLAVQIASGLLKAHDRGIIHRDIKPGNVLVTPEGQAKVLDFGIAQLTGQTRLTRAGSLVGTAAYLPPEALRGQPVDPRMDVWSLGVVLYEMVAGRRPFQGDGKALMFSILQLKAPPMSAARPEVPAELDRIVARALEKNAADRYPGFAEMLADLDALRLPPPGSEETLAETPSLVAPAVVEAGAAQRPESAWTGRQVAQYRILRRLGGGGMGVVYEAEDTRLVRKVALKFLPPQLTLDPEGKARFLREAQTASAMDHPNLCTIYEAGETEDGQLFLAMPRYDGETLRQRLKSGPLPVVEAADVARQIAQGLAKVHRQGIVHRDIKPANLIVTADGIVKILDFGIAKLTREADAPMDNASAGTPAYRSPEQTSGEAVDARTDLWSLGVVLYEMLAGKRPFRGEPEQAVAYAVLHDEPEPLPKLRPEVQPELARIVARLLSKDPQRRYPAAEEAVADLRTFSGDVSGLRPAVGADRSPRATWRWAAILGAVALLAGVWAFRSFSSEPARTAATYERITDQPGLETSPSLSPDGRSFVYVKEVDGDVDICRQEIGSTEVVNLTANSPSADSQPAFSADGQWIAFRSDRQGGGIFIMDRDGGRVRHVSREGHTPSWSPDGKQIVYATEGVFEPGMRVSQSELWRVEIATRRPHLVTAGDAVQPSWSPNGLRIAYWGIKETRRVLWTIPAEGGTAVPIVDDDQLNWSPFWSRDGKRLYFASDRAGSMNLWEVPIDERSGRALDDPEPLSTPAQWSALPSLSADGRKIVYAVNESRLSLEKVPFDPVELKATGPGVAIVRGSRAVRSAKPSPDGRWIVFDTEAPQEDLFLARPDGQVVRRLTDDPYKDRSPVWSPDGSRILFYSDRTGSYEAWTIRPDGGGLEQVTAIGKNVMSPLWSPDGKRLAVNLDYSGTFLIDLTVPIEQRRPLPLPRAAGTKTFFAAMSWSEDGGWLAGMGSFGLSLYSFRLGRQIDLQQRCLDPVWLQGDRTLLCVNSTSVLAVDLEKETFRSVLSPPPHSYFRRLSISPDGRDLYIVRGTEEGDIWMSTLE